MISHLPSHSRSPEDHHGPGKNQQEEDYRRYAGARRKKGQYREEQDQSAERCDIDARSSKRAVAPTGATAELTVPSNPFTTTE